MKQSELVRQLKDEINENDLMFIGPNDIESNMEEYEKQYILAGLNLLIALFLREERDAND